MGTLNKYLNSAAVEEALDKGVAAYDKAKGTKINGVAVTGELDSQTDLKIAGKVTDDNGVAMLHASSAKNGGLAVGGGCQADSGIAMGVGCQTNKGGIAFGSGSQAVENGYVAMGGGSKATTYGIAIGGGCLATENCASAIGGGCRAIGQNSVAMGGGTEASGLTAVSIGGGSKASADYSTAIGYSLLASSEAQTVVGMFNAEESNGKYAFIIGNGETSTKRSNAIAIGWDGKFYPHNSETGIDLIEIIEAINFTPRFIGRYNIPWLIQGQGSLQARLYQLQKNVFSIDINGGGTPYTTEKTSYSLPVDIPVRRYNPSNDMVPYCSPAKVGITDDEKLLIGMVGYHDGTIIISVPVGKAVASISEANIIVYGELIEDETAE